MRFKSQQSNKVRPELVVSTDKSRPVLTHVHLDTEKSQVVATDSSMLARFPVDLDESDTTGPIPTEALKASRKPPSKFGEVAIRANSHVEVTDNGTAYVTLPRDSADYQFPDADRLFPENLAAFRIGLDAGLLYKLAKAMGNERVVLQFTADVEGGPSNLKAMYVTPLHHAEGDADGILMPLRVT